MFKFDFDIKDEDEESQAGPSSPRAVQAIPESKNVQPVRPCYRISLNDLLESLPATISYSPIPLPPHLNIPPLLRRDLYDARFQLASKEDEVGMQKVEDDEWIDGDTDLVKGLYEGGLKTWEGGLDLVEVLSDVADLPGWVKGTKVLEIGCGTALPTAFILRQLLSDTTNSENTKTTLHLQDYNLQVLKLVTLPNLILASLPFLPPEVLHQAQNADDMEGTVPDLISPGEVTLSGELKKGFAQLLSRCGVELNFTYGDWSGLADELKGGEEGYGLILTSETIYEGSSLGSLIDLLRNASLRGGDSEAKRVKGDVEVEVGLEESLEGLKVKEDWKSTPLRKSTESVVLVGAKVLYFGLTGDLQTFLTRIEEQGGWWENVKSWTKGVGRKVVRVGW